ncbi:MAG TPA: hypothetical protein VHV30_13975 [Polyangiaceae bacterium]|nr:hypothetical protein [Polyangiaceae bacterium]
MSDATEDPKESFASLGNAIRRVREDFGVEIELDVAPLRAGASGWAAQHAVAGTIHYDGLDGIAKGQIIYFRPTFTGDEPADLMEHRARHPAFPNDSTGDQFYDEPQWESYRRLGQHCATEVMALRTVGGENFVEEMFYLAAERWQYVDPTTREKLVALSDRRAALAKAGPGLFDAFPEATLAIAPDRPTDIEPLMGVVQLMEDVWRVAHLETEWSQPINAPWINFFERAANTPSFRRWWPLLRSLFDTRFATFITDRYQLEFGTEHEMEKAHVVIEPVTVRELGATAPALARRLRTIGAKDDGLALRLRLHFEDNGGIKTKPVVVAALLYQETGDDGEMRRVVTWRPDDYVIHAVVQRGHLSRHCIEALTAHFREDGVDELRIDLEPRRPEPAADKRASGRHVRRQDHMAESRPAVEDPLCTESADRSQEGAAWPWRRPLSPAERWQLVEAIALYKSHGFEYCAKRTPGDVPSYIGVMPATFLVKRLRQGPSAARFGARAAE